MSLSFVSVRPVMASRILTVYNSLLRCLYSNEDDGMLE